MWSQTNLCGARAKNARFRATVLGAALMGLFLLASCGGYNLASDNPSILGDGSKTIKIKNVDYPTLQPWLPHLIRSALRDEINARYLAQWVDSGPADFEIQIRVKSYTTREWMRDGIDYTKLYDSEMALEATIYDGRTNKPVWRSGEVFYSDRLELPNEQLAATDIVTQLIRKLADKMRSTF